MHLSDSKGVIHINRFNIAKAIKSGKSYSILPTKGFHDDIGEFITYGIIGIDPVSLSVLQDVTLCRETVEKMTNLFNKHQLSAIHLEDVVTDMLP